MMFADYHIHTYYSDDSTYPMEQVVKDAISKGITDLCFTDHVDYGIKEDTDKLSPEQRQELKLKIQNPNVPQYNVDYPAYVAEYQDLKEKYADKINLKLGMEFGLQIHTIPQYQKLFNSYPFDFIIMSCHQVENKEFWTQEFQQGRSQDEYNQRYYDEILAQVKNYHDYSVLGHLDLIARYDKAGIYPFAKIQDKIAEILKIVIADGKGIIAGQGSSYTDCTFRKAGTHGYDGHADNHGRDPEPLCYGRASFYKEVGTFDQQDKSDD